MDFPPHIAPPVSCLNFDDSFGTWGFYVEGVGYVGSNGMITQADGFELKSATFPAGGELSK